MTFRLFVVLVLLTGVFLACQNATPEAVGGQAEAKPRREVVGKVYECRRAIGPRNHLRISGGASCTDARLLFVHPIRNQQLFRGWTCNQQSLGRYGPILNFCAHGRLKRVSYLFQG